MKIDAHHHCWRYTPEEFAWIDDRLRGIRRNFYPADLAPLLKATGIDGTVVVQTRAIVEETLQLLEHTHRHRFIKGVVGWVPLTDPKVGRLLEQLQEDRALKGVRHALQGEPDGYMADPAFNAGLATLAARGLSFDLLVKAPQLPTVTALVDRHPDLPFVLDHLAKPVIAGTPPPEWRRHITELARRPNVCCKFSGLVNQVPDFAWTPELLWPWFDIVLEAFGATRLMFGSGWPVCLVATEYPHWYRFIASCVTGLTLEERNLILGGTATRFYRLVP